MEFLRDPFWQFIGAVLALIAIAVSVVLYLLQRKRKVLAYEIVSRTPLLSVKEEVKGRVQITFDGQPVSDATMVILKLLNSGNVPILPFDFLRPVNIGFGKDAQILSAEIIETNPDNIEASVEVGAQTLTLVPVLLNGGDSVTLKVLLTRFEGDVDVNGRIVGVKQIQSVKENPMPLVAVFGGMIATMIGVSFLTLQERPEEFGVSIVLAGYTLMFSGMFSSRKYRRYMYKALKEVYANALKRIIRS